MPCPGCGGSRNRNNRNSPQASAFGQRKQAAAQMNDSDFVLVEYRHRNKGRHQVTGGYLFPDRLPGIRMRNRGNGWSIDYGQRGGGEKFLVHRADVSVQQHFIPVRESVAQIAPEPVKEPLPEPELVTQEIESDLVKSILEPPVEIEDSELVEEVQDLFKQSEESSPREFDLQLLPGVGPALAGQLEANGILTKDDVIALGVEGLQAYHGVGQTKAERILSTIARMNT